MYDCYSFFSKLTVEASKFSWSSYDLHYSFKQLSSVQKVSDITTLLVFEVEIDVRTSTIGPRYERVSVLVNSNVPTFAQLFDDSSSRSVS